MARRMDSSRCSPCPQGRILAWHVGENAGDLLGGVCAGHEARLGAEQDLGSSRTYRRSSRPTSTPAASERAMRLCACLPGWPLSRLGARMIAGRRQFVGRGGEPGPCPHRAVLDVAAGIAGSWRPCCPCAARGRAGRGDGGSRDVTVALARRWPPGVRSAPGRARQMNAGAVAQGEGWSSARGHATAPDADNMIRQAFRVGAHWGRFGRAMPVVPGCCRIAALMNWRSRLTGVATGDQAIFLRREFRACGWRSRQPLMEDVELRRGFAGRAYSVLRAAVVTSGRRWESRGVWRTIFLMWRLRWRYWRGESPQRLAKAYR